MSLTPEDSAARTDDAPSETASTASPAEPVALPSPGPLPPPAAPRARLRPRALAVGALGFLALFVQHCLTFQVPYGAWLGLASTLVATVGWLRGLGFLEAGEDDRPLRSTWLGPLPGEQPASAPFVAFPVAAILAVLVLLTAGGDATVLGVGLFVACCVFALPAVRRPFLLPIVALTMVYLPRLGVSALWDPWETHYGEVAREMLARDDWISLWWAQERWFWSKPILVFWTEAFTMSAFGVDASPDAQPVNPEWALRLPVFLMSLAAVVGVQAFVTRAFGRRAGILSALVVGTMPHFFLLAHQAITDMPLTASTCVAMAALGTALLADDTRTPQAVRIAGVGVSGRSLVAGAILALALPQISYLLSRNLRITERLQVQPALDVFLEGSAGNFDVPGNPAYVDQFPVYGNLQPVLQGVVWAFLLALVLFLFRFVRTRRDVAMMVFYVACAFGLVGKGIPGVALPGLVAFLYLLVSGRWALLTTGRLHVMTGALVVVLLGLPWYVAMTIRHGRPFLDRIVVHDHINRLAVGVHGDNGPIEYFLNQLGAGGFPTIGLVPFAVLAFLHVARSAEPSHEREAARLVGLWAMVGFTLFNAMVTKFHHYIFPVIPPAGVLVGVVLARAVPEGRTDRVAAAVGALGTVLLLLGVGGSTGDLRGIVPDGATDPDWVLAHPLPLVSTACLIGAGLAALGWAGRRLRDPDTTPLTSLERGLAAAMLGAAVLTAFIGRDLAWKTATRPHGQERFAHLFIYMYSRPVPEYIDYRPVFTALAVVSTAALAALAMRATRRLALVSLLVTALVTTAFSVNVYLPEIAHNWSGKALIRRYYAQRSGHEPLLAFQMNWKGENFYTGNRVHVFQDIDTTNLRNWIARSRGTTAYVLVEHARYEGFRGLLPSGSTMQKRSTVRDNNKFVLARVTIAPLPPT